MRHVNSVIKDFKSKEHDPMIPNYLFNGFESKPIVLIDILFWNENEIEFTKKKYDFRIVWKTKRIRQLFPLREKTSYPSCQIYRKINL